MRPLLWTVGFLVRSCRFIWFERFDWPFSALFGTVGIVGLCSSCFCCRLFSPGQGSHVVSVFSWWSVRLESITQFSSSEGLPDVAAISQCYFWKHFFLLHCQLPAIVNRPIQRVGDRLVLLSSSLPPACQR